MNDTVGLLQSCHRGTITAVNSLEQVMDHVQNREMEERLQKTLTRHKALGEDVGIRLKELDRPPQDPNPMAKAMVWFTTEMRLMASSDDRDHAIATMVINGCNTGIQELSADINRFQDAAGDTQDLAAALVKEEQRLMDDLRLYL